MNDCKFDVIPLHQETVDSVSIQQTPLYRLTHYPTGIVIYSQTEKSQLQNKEKAFALLRAKLYDLECQKQHDAEAEARRARSEQETALRNPYL